MIWNPPLKLYLAKDLFKDATTLAKTTIFT